MKTSKRTQWEKKLTAKEIKHVREWCGGTLAGIKATRATQRLGADACFECRQIAKKLGLE